MFNKLCIFTVVIFAFINITPLNVISKEKTICSTEKNFKNKITGWWKPLSLQFDIYDVRDSVILSDTISYDSLFISEGAESAYLHFKNDTLYECIVYDTCYKESTTELFFNGEQFYYMKQPLLLGNSTNCCRKEETLVLNGKKILQSTITVYFDSLQEKRFKRSVSNVFFTRSHSSPDLRKLHVCN